jgi:hypothetical protein
VAPTGAERLFTSGSGFRVAVADPSTHPLPDRLAHLRLGCMLFLRIAYFISFSQRRAAKMSLFFYPAWDET